MGYVEKAGSALICAGQIEQVFIDLVSQYPSARQAAMRQDGLLLLACQGPASGVVGRAEEDEFGVFVGLAFVAVLCTGEDD